MRVEDGKISRTIFSNIRHLMQHEEKLSFLFCGTHKLEEMSADYWSIFFNSAYTRKQMLDTLDKLVSRDILEEKEMRYRFPVNILRKWLAARFPLRKVREEI